MNQRLVWLATFACAASVVAAPKRHDLIISSRMVLSAPLTDENVDTLKFTNGAVLVTNGFEIRLHAESVKVDGHATITAFEGPASPGNSGAAAGAIYLRLRHVQGGQLTIDNSGQDGGVGKPGHDGAPGQRGKPGRPRYWNLVEGCHHTGSDGETGGPGGNGDRGQDGGSGGNSAKVTLSIPQATAARRVFAVVTHGGSGGEPGRGGFGGPGGPGGWGASETSMCDETNPGLPGPQGRNGASGLPGRDGIASEFEVKKYPR